MNRAFYALARWFVGLVFRLLWRFEAIDADKVPRTGAVIIACNHVAYLDPPALGVAAPRPVAYMAKRELFAIPLLGPVISALGAFPVDRTRGDMAAIKAAIGVLAGDGVLGIFPEGGRRGKNDEVEGPKIGAAFLAAKTGATVIPAYVGGTARAKRFARITVRFGDPVQKRLDRKASRDELAKWTNELMDRITALRETTGGH